MYHAKNKKCKRQMTEGTKQPNQENIRTLREKETYKYLGILEAGMKEKKQTKLHCKNLSKV